MPAVQAAGRWQGGGNVNAWQAALAAVSSCELVGRQCGAVQSCSPRGRRHVGVWCRGTACKLRQAGPGAGGSPAGPARCRWCAGGGSVAAAVWWRRQVLQWSGSHAGRQRQVAGSGGRCVASGAARQQAAGAGSVRWQK